MSARIRMAEGQQYPIRLLLPPSDKVGRYKGISALLKQLFETSRRDREVIERKMTAILFEYLPDINWAGFYFVRDGKLELGPYQGKIACDDIAFGEGACG